MRRHRPRQHLGRKDEEAVGIADGRRQHAQAAEHGRRIFRAVVGVEHARRGDRLGAAAASAASRAPARLRAGIVTAIANRLAGGMTQPRAVLGGRIVDGRIGIAVLADDGDLRMPAGRRLGELHVHVGDVADIREHPDLGLAGLALDDRLELAVDGELHVPLVVGQRRDRPARPVRLAVRAP